MTNSIISSALVSLLWLTTKDMTKVQKEIWKDIAGYEGLYQVSNLGGIKSLPRNSTRGGILKPLIHRGYSSVELCKNNIKKRFRVHRLEAFAFLPNPKNKPYINHKNGIRNDNRLENIEWCTNSENQLHSYRELGRINHRPCLGKTGALCKNSRPVNQYDLRGNFIKTWPGQSEAARQLGLYQTNISHACKGNYKSCGGYKWKYA